MSRTADLYIEAENRLCEQLEREPKWEEIEEEVKDMCASQIDYAKDRVIASLEDFRPDETAPQ